MKKKESIHQLQERLAQRLAVSSQSGAVATWLAIELADERFLLPLKQSGEIFSLPKINKLNEFELKKRQHKLAFFYV